MLILFVAVSPGPRTMPGGDGYSENMCCINNCHPSPSVFPFVGSSKELGIHRPASLGRTSHIVRSEEEKGILNIFLFSVRKMGEVEEG